MRDSLTLGRIAGIRFGVNWSWAIVFALIVWTLATGIFPSTNPGHDQRTYIAMAIVAALLFFTSLLMHEFGHALEAKREGVEIEGITLWLFGGVAKFRGMFPSAGAEFRIAIAGPLVSLVLGPVFVLLAWKASLPEVDRWCRRVARLHQPHPAGLQSPARAAARRRPRASIRPLGARAATSAGRPTSPRSSAAASATSSSSAASRSSSGKAPTAGSGSPSSAGSSCRLRRRRTAPCLHARPSVGCASETWSSAIR